MLDACVVSLLSATADMVPAKVEEPLPELFKQCARAIECMGVGFPSGPLRQRAADASATFKAVEAVLEAMQSSRLIPDAGSEQPPATTANLLTVSRALEHAASAGKKYTTANVKALQEAAESHLRAAAAATCENEVSQLAKVSKDLNDMLSSDGEPTGTFADKHMANTTWPDYLKLAQETVMKLDGAMFKELPKAHDDCLITLDDLHQTLHCEKTWGEHAEVSKLAWHVCFVRELVGEYSKDLSSANAKALAREATNAVIASAFARGISKADFAPAMQARMVAARKLKLA